MLICNCTLPTTNPDACKNCQVYINYYNLNSDYFDFNNYDYDQKELLEFIENIKNKEEEKTKENNRHTQKIVTKKYDGDGNLIEVLEKYIY